MTHSTASQPRNLDKSDAAVIADERPQSLGQRLRGHYARMISTSWLFSALLHVLVLFVIGKMFLPMLPEPPIQELVMGESADAIPDLDEFHDLQVRTDSADAEISSTSSLPLRTDLTIAVPKLSASRDDPVLTNVVPRVSLADSLADNRTPMVRGRAGAVATRENMGASELRGAGGNAGSEAAVKESLIWLVHHQLPDGGWTLQHNRRVNGCNCRNSGFKKNDQLAPPKVYEARFGATGLALLPFLGSGRTHLKGEYQHVVEGGLAFLVNGMRRDGNRGSLRDKGNYYSHGICTIAVCEAYAMTKDPSLAGPAQALVNEIIFGQDPVGGGWRYTPKQPGDTSVTGWQFMALKSAKMAGLNVPTKVMENANAFFDRASMYDGAYAATDCVIAKLTQTELFVNIPAELHADKKSVKKPARQVVYTGLDMSKTVLQPGQPLAKGAPIAPYAEDKSDLEGWRYRYMVVPDLPKDRNEIEPAHPTPTLTAVGMLCRMYYGWEQGNPLLQRTVDYLAEQGPSVAADSRVEGPNMYYNYYATQVLRHRGTTEQWTAWNETVRDFLIEAQEVSGHERGSWFFGEHAHGDTHGGRLYATALASMILEVYYRHLPLYQDDATTSFLD